MSCPREVKIIDLVRSMRSMVVEAGAVPESLKAMIGSCHSNGNPWSGPREKRLEWAQGLKLPAFGPDTEYFLFVCCTACYDIRSRNIARSLARLLQRAGVSFGVIGQEESCCGESLRKVGDEQGFLRLASANVELFKSRGVKKIITISPHCYYAFTRDYRQLGADFEVIHSSQLLRKLVSEGTLKVSYRLNKRITYHDPCYLGRQSDETEAPRRVLGWAGLNLVEMAHSRRDALCCGAGGGQMWKEEEPGDQRVSALRLAEAQATSAALLATACPFCNRMLGDASAQAGGMVPVKDVAELLVEAIQTAPTKPVPRPL
jgi:Fe-S oxidoreductase